MQNGFYFESRCPWFFQSLYTHDRCSCKVAPGWKKIIHNLSFLTRKEGTFYFDMMTNAEDLPLSLKIKTYNFRANH